MWERRTKLLLTLVFVAGCPAEGDSLPDAPPAVGFQMFSSMTWSAAMATGTQFSITSTTGTAACASAQNHANGIGAAGHQLLLHLPAAGGPCAQGTHTLGTACPLSLGADAFVPANCAYYRRFDAQGLLGIATSLNGSVSIGGTPGSCSVRVTVGFNGGNFNEMQTMTFTGAQPWCI